MDVGKLISVFQKDREGKTFLLNPGDKPVKISARVVQTGNEPFWALITSGNDARIEIAKGDQFFALSKSGKNPNDNKPITYGIYFKYDPLRVVMDIKFESSTQILTLIIRDAASLIFYTTTTKKIVPSSFKKWSGNLETPILGSPTISMDSKSPTHNKTGINEIKPFGHF